MTTDRTLSYSILIPFVPTRHEQVLSVAGLVRFGRAHRLWQGQSLLADAHQTFAHLAASGFSVPTGIGVDLTPMRHPVDAALQARSVARAMDRPMVAGFGPGSRDLQAALLGAPYSAPVTAAEDYVTIVRALLGGGPVDITGSVYSCRMELPVLSAPPIEIGLGVLRPAMARAAGRVADVAVCWLTPPEWIADVIRPALHAAAESAGRRPPRIVAMVPVVPSDAGDDRVDAVRAACGGHLTMPHYRDMLRRAGVLVDDEDFPATARSLLRSGAVVGYDANARADRFRRYADAGADEVVLNATGTFMTEGLPRAIEDLEAVLDGAPEVAVSGHPVGVA
ncbi:LLM class flavin-dependent oxidoreductase [Rhodococcoides corynebacterioides]|uniref:LLM class flavin-dependent oxidoreductase n=1 Tax=Rhodococcoides corynebacterioides TaxID=53972 RepID=UPI001C9A843D|nr:LLM class flavin-dependent oxidoreductase [Rhodococcus corynebacterioides]MBY6350958.1 LLM class flavin-dependent oxidoreductase [Rhodococcus corynebacterioides]